MDRYVTGACIRKFRERHRMTQEDLAAKIHVSGKAVSKWETGRGFPDISLLEALAQALNLSVTELLSGNCAQNANKAANMLKCKLYVCPVCGNVMQTTGAAAVSCCGIALPPLEAEAPDNEHEMRVEISEDEYFVSVRHPMTKEHYLSFLCAVADNETRFVKLYPEGPAEARFPIRRVRKLYACCNRHGLFQLNV